MSSLEKSKKTELHLLLFALGIPLIGEQTAQKISDKIYTLFKKTKKPKEKLDISKALFFLENITAKELEEITDVGPLAANSFCSAFQNEELIKDLKRLHKKGVFFLKKAQTEKKLEGLKIAITGKFPIPRQKIKKKIIEQGGRLLTQLSQKTDFLLVGDKPGSKREKARDLNLKILTWEEFLKLIR